MMFSRLQIWLPLAGGLLAAGCAASPVPKPMQSPPPSQSFEQTGLAGVWEVSDGSLEKTLTVDCHGTGRYDWQDGMVVTTDVRDGYWAGTWHQAGNDREGGFEVLLSPDRRVAEGRWWYSRVGDAYFQPGERGGSFSMSRPLHVVAEQGPCRSQTVHEVHVPY